MEEFKDGIILKHRVDMTNTISVPPEPFMYYGGTMAFLTILQRGLDLLKRGR